MSSKTPRPAEPNEAKIEQRKDTPSRYQRKQNASYDDHLLKCRLPEYLRAIGCELHFTNEDHFSTACPIHGGVKKNFHADRQSDGRWVWTCFSGCGGEGGTVLDLHARRHGLSDFYRSVVGVAEVLGIGPDMIRPRPIVRRTPKPRPKKEVKFPVLDGGTPGEIEALAVLRYFSKEAVQRAVDLGSLRFGHVCGERSWILTDASRKIAEARRLDGEFYEDNLGRRKSHTLAGSSKSWPVGLQLTDEMPAPDKKIVLVEGGPDYLAAIDFTVRFDRDDVHPVAMLGKAAISPDAIKILSGRRVRIFPHQDPDDGGMEAAIKWHKQLVTAGCQVDGFSFDGLTKIDWTAVTDLNDLLEADEQSRKIWKEVLP